MDSFLHWFSQYNTLIIQSLSVTIGLTLVYFLYRQFFIPQRAVDEINPNAKMDGIEKKISTLIDTLQTPAGPTASVEELAKAQSEIESLKKDGDHFQERIIAKDGEIANLSEQITELKNKSDSIYVDINRLTGDAGLIGKIDQLQQKLMEYEIIAEDIAELQGLRKENAELKSKING